MSSVPLKGKERSQVIRLADGSELLVRPMETEDVSRVAELEREIFSMPWSEKAFLEEVERQDRLFAVVYQGEQLAGYMGLIPSFEEADITNVAVSPLLRRRGIAEHMLSVVLQWGRESGINAFTLEVRAGNGAAVALYEKMGFVCEGRRKNFYEKPREDALIMWKR